MTNDGRPRLVSDEEFAEVLLTAFPPLLTATEIADEVGLSPSGVRKRLDVLDVAFKKSTGNGNVYCHVDLLHYRRYTLEQRGLWDELES